MPDTMLMIEFIKEHWYGDGLEGYVTRKAFNDPSTLLNLAIALLNRIQARILPYTITVSSP